MNVLVYSGPSVLPASLSGALALLRAVLVPNYAVQTLSSAALLSQPWHTSCALLVLPSRSQAETPAAAEAISRYLTAGGSLLAFGAVLRRRGILSITSPGSFKLSDVTLSCDEQLDLAVTRKAAVKVHQSDGNVINAVCTAAFAEEDEESGAPAFATVDTTEEVVAYVRDVGQGKVIAWRASLDAESQGSAATNIQSTRTVVGASLAALGLRLPPQTLVARPVPQMLMSAPWKPKVVDAVFSALRITHTGGSEPVELKDMNDTFHFHPLSDSDNLFASARAGTLYPSPEPATWQPKHIIIYPDGKLPPTDATSLFDCARFYDELRTAHRAEQLAESLDTWGIGDAMLYAEVVTSTQTMIDRNGRMLGALPAPLLSLASHQLTGRGRGANTWLSPAGCLQFSLLLRVPLAVLPPHRLVFVQYLFGLAVVEAARALAREKGERWGEQVRLKWPNDIYAVTGPRDEDRKKIGGILINTSISGTQVEIVIGSGTNILNPPPITSLAQLLPEGAVVEDHLKMERALALILVKFEAMWTTFLQDRGSFQSFMDLYLERWMHSDQAVTLTTVSPARRVRIVGLADDGRLRTIAENEGWSAVGGSGFIDLQPDGNSFDIMAGLIKAK